MGRSTIRQQNGILVFLAAILLCAWLTLRSEVEPVSSSDIIPASSSDTIRVSTPTASQLKAPKAVEELGNNYEDDYSVYNCRGKHLGLHGSLPNFLVIGVHKGGSTALYGYLAKHGHIRPAVCKETKYLADQRLTRKLGIAGYRRFFRDLSDTPWMQTGEGTPSYSRLPHVPALVASWMPKVRVVMTLRDPVKRFISHFVGFRERGLSEATCDEFFYEQVKTLEDCGKTTGSDWRTTPSHDCLAKHNDLAIVRSMYGSQLWRWAQYLSPEQILPVQAEMMFKNTSETMNTVVSFLGLRPYSAWELSRFAETDRGTHHVGTSLSKTCDLERLSDFFRVEVNEVLYPILDTLPHGSRKGWLPWSTLK